ncbi:MAG: hypothetical protein AB1736_15230, partial [Chloroflexota bacterium]
ATRALGATRSVAGAAAAGRRASRDFRLSPADAARLRQRGPLGIAWPASWATRRSRGLGGALATLGLVGLLVAAGLPGLAGGTASAPDVIEMGTNWQKASAAPHVGPAAGDRPAPASSGDPTRAEDQAREQVAPPSPVTVLAVGSAAALVLGLVLLIAGSRRGRAGP